ncbi:MAG: sodium/solute symporter [Candidatus Sericytochromatia bacterium]|nr:sodium/solute symporter [Candidatus Sericytochromatia bacterium]
MHALDWTVIAIYLVAVAGLGLWIGKRQKGVEDFFLGGHSIPWWAALLSLIATEISAATFLGAPEQGYTRDLTYLQFAIGSITARFVLATVFIAAFYRYKVFTVYGLLLQRFGLATNATSAGIFLLGRFFADGSRLFIASIAINVITGLDIATSILILGGITLVYTCFGGITAVIWTDVAQSIVLVSGALTLVWSLLGHIDLPFGTIAAELAAADKYRLFDTRWLMADGAIAPLFNPYHVLPALIGGFFLTMATHGTDHDMVQRLLTCRTSKEGQRSMWVSGLLGVSVTCLFLFIGQLLFVYIKHLPADHVMLQTAQALKTSGKNGHLLLHYIINEMPIGLRGLVIAAVLAASMSSLSSAMNATTATFITDFYRPYFVKHADSAHYLKASRIATIGIGSLPMGAALMVARFYEANPKTDLLSIALGIMTFFYGALLGIFLVALYTRTRGNSVTNLTGAVSSIATVIVVQYQFKPAWPWFIVIGTLVTVAISLLGRTAADMQASFARAGDATTGVEAEEGLVRG